MPKVFAFLIDHHVTFQCILNSTRCQGTSRTTNLRCRCKCIIGYEYCHHHMPIYLHLQIRQSTIPNAGFGLFAYNGTNNNDIIFRPDDTITAYNGQLITTQQKPQRYGNKTAPYAVQINNNYAIDAAP